MWTLVNAATTARRCATASFVNTCIVFHCITRGSAAECRLVFIEPSCSLQQLLSVSNISRHVAALDTTHPCCPISTASHNLQIDTLQILFKYFSNIQMLLTAGKSMGHPILQMESSSRTKALLGIEAPCRADN